MWLRAVDENRVSPIPHPELAIYPLHEIPSYNEDLDGAAIPHAVSEFREAVRAADGLIIGCPEYNHGMSGLLKNALDWLSRPHGKSVLIAKPVLTFTASPAFTGGVNRPWFRRHLQAS
jgi:chromate reductase